MGDQTRPASLAVLNFKDDLNAASEASDAASWKLDCHSACNIDPLSRGIGVQN
jgi:hypothetical protein